MRVVVDLDLCCAHGVCEREAPELFRVIDGPGSYAHVDVLLDHVPEELRGRAKAAESQCPNQVITIID